MDHPAELALAIETARVLTFARWMISRAWDIRVRTSSSLLDEMLLLLSLLTSEVEGVEEEPEEDVEEDPESRISSSSVKARIIRIFSWISSGSSSSMLKDTLNTAKS